MDYVGTELRTVLGINKIFSVHYFEYMSDYTFEGERHDFWEMLYVDKGEVEVDVDGVTITCGCGEIIFHRPNEFHALRANGVIAPNLMVVSFECLSEDMKLFENEHIYVSGHEKKILSQIIVEAKGAFSSPLDQTFLAQLTRHEEQLYGSEQMIGLYIQQLLISLIRHKKEKNNSGQKTSRTGDVMTKENYDAYIYQRALGYMNEQIQESLTLNEICRDIMVSRSKLQSIFNTRHHCGVMHYFSEMKIERSKKLMREAHMNFTGIADYLGYKSIHYFSRQFKKITNMTPTEYVSSVKSMSEAQE